MSNVRPPRIRRLENELAELTQLARDSSLFEFATEGSAPTVYEVTLYCRGLARANEQIVQVSLHQFGLTLGPNFPLTPPGIVWRTPIYHPNFYPPDACTGDLWYPASSLAELCESLIDLVQYKNFNVYDPLDRDATAWLEERLLAQDLALPVDDRPVRDLADDTERAAP